MDDYPNIDDENFQFSLSQHLEFVNLDNIDGLYPHQEFVRRFMSPYTPYTSLIMYHSLGSGKSIACIAVAVDHYLHDKKKCIIVTKGDSGTNNFQKQIMMYRDMSSRTTEWNESIFIMRHYISLANQIYRMSDYDIARTFSNKIIVLDEVHNVRYLKTVVDRSVYGSIIKLLQLCKNVKIIMATATPMTDNADQIHSLLGICNHSRNDPYSMKGIISYNPTIRDRPMSSEIGTDLYVEGMHVYASDMIAHQREAYSKEYTTQPPDDIYRALTHISLFCFKDGTYGRDITETKMVTTKHKTMITSMSTRQTREIKYIKYNVLPDDIGALTGNSLRQCSSKYSALIDKIEGSSGNVFVFIEEVKGSGLLLLAAILEQHGYELYVGESLENMLPGKRYTMCVGSVDICPNNVDRLDGFNSDMNKDGQFIKVLLGSKVIGESITLMNVRHFHCLTPHWNDSTVDQAIGRVVRNGSHVALEKDKKNVDIYIHASIFPDDPQASVDIKKLEKCKQKEKSIKIVEQNMIDVAVDRYCLIEQSPEPIKYYTNFAAAYVHNHMNAVLAAIADVLNKHDRYLHVLELSDELDVHPIVCKEVLCRAVSSNIPISSQVFLRAYGDYVFAVDDPSLPSVVMPGAVVRKAQIPHHEIPMPTTDFIRAFRYMPVKRKAQLLEECIAHGRQDALALINTTYANINNVLFHLLSYRELESSYTSVNPVPKKPLGKTRYFRDNRWRTLRSIEFEQAVFDEYKPLVTALIDKADAEYPIYGIISTIDGDMRIRLRQIEDKRKSSSDSRYVRRGKNMKSIKKEYLLKILRFVNKTEPPANASINDIVQLIDDAIVQAGWYIVI